MNLAERLSIELTDLGVDCLFGLMGDGNIFLVDCYARGPGQYIAAAHEAGSVLMAGGYAQTTGRVGFCTVTHGPGLTNTLTALVDAVRSHTPLVLIAGDTSPDQTANLQHIDQHEIALASGAGFVGVSDASGAVSALGDAIALAQERRGPVVLNVPARLWGHEFEDSRPAPDMAGNVAPPAVDAADLDRALGLMASSNRPMILAGAGARDPSARDALLRLAEHLDAPLATSLRGKAMFRDSPRDLGILGTLARDASIETFGNRDCIVAFGASLNPWTTFGGAFVSGRRIVQVDLDPDALGRFTPVDVGVVGEVADVAEEMLRWLATDNRSALPDPTPKSQVPRSAPAATRVGASDSPVDLETVLRRLNESIPADRTLVCDSGRHVGPALKLLDVDEPRAYVHTQAFGSIGLGMGYAVGAAFGRPGHRVLLTVGDGGFMLGGLTEFNTAVRYDLDIIVVVLNDGAYGAEYEQFTQRDIDPALSTFTWPELAPVAQALGGTGFTVRTYGDLDAVLPRLANVHGPVLVDVVIDPAQVPPLTRAQ
jgi:thiamine pyrophosphate-dependent acetolactate synthase large subunit-like protein